MNTEQTNIDIDNPEFKNALKLVQDTSQSVFLTGKAGTGKSTFLRYICSLTHKKYVVVAPTGIAAINAGGQTIHSFFKMPFRPMLPDDNDLSTKNNRIYEFLKYRKSHVKLIKELELLVIDEVSMLRVDILDFIDRVLRVYRGKTQIPFGGVQLLMVGDVFQLEPVVPSAEWNILNRFYKTPFFFSARAFRKVPMVQIELNKIYRQSDSEFVNILDKVRVNKATIKDLDVINNCCDPNFEPPVDELFITLATRRNTVDFTNENKLNKLDSEEHIFEGEIIDNFPDSALPTPKTLVLKENAQVMFVKNDSSPQSGYRRWYNGTLGRIDEISEDGIFVRLEDDNVYKIEREHWSNVRYTFDEKNKCIVEEEIGSYTQYPIKLAWAITVHKSQGLTFDRAMLDFTGGAFAGGQLYVALSRCRSLTGLVLKNRVKASDVIVRPVCVEFSKRANNALQIEQSFKYAQADDLYKDSLKLFKRGSFFESVRSFASAVEKRNILSQASIQRLISRQFNIINKLKAEIKDLHTKQAEKDKQLAELAKEFLLMANECLSKADDKLAAIANLNKAITLNPKYFEALLLRASLRVESEEYNMAESDYSLILDFKPRNYKALYNRARTRMELLNYEGAYTDMLKASKVKSTRPKPYLYLSQICNKLGEDQEADKYEHIYNSLIDEE